ncbi:MAG: hypothetical protein C0505_19265 [Leptothrix sp. (in: Bacteria)]|nr:hypothetical protein [Leptothrix sp. (in: b-proteobacteria)]
MRAALATACVALAATFAQTPIAHAAGGDGTGPAGGAGMGPGTGMMACGGTGMDHHGPRGGMGPDGGLGMGPYGARGMGPDGARAMGRMLDLAKATPEQRAQIQKIADAARADMAAQREASGQLHAQSRAIFTQPTIDARAAEALRQQMLAHHDQASKRMLQMRLDMAAVLTAEQRKLIAERMTQRFEMMQRHRSERAALGGAPGR